jgi:Fe-S-cluster-containing dehydrogenase component/DMSO reductase anchor subunit
MTLLSSVAALDETPIDRYLSAQADLTAVERFAQRHEADLLPSQARYYQDLIPLARPQPGQQYGFEVDLDACTGCKACVTACHSLNGLDDGESWRSVTLLSGNSAGEPFQQTVTAACHHCLDPACLTGCPVDAYEKDPVTGIVVHLDDQCIGCSYCTLTCPYEVPVFNKGRGIVRKCDMCHGRLTAGEAPACVQACPNGAIRIALVDSAATSSLAAAGGVLVPGAPPSAITGPATVYRTERGRIHDLPAAPSPNGPAAAHTPLAVMLVLTQLSVGAFVTDLVVRGFTDRGAPGRLQPFDAAVAAAAGVLALAASVLHLGRPRYFYRAVIGLRHSWLSREVIAFGAFTGLAVPYALALWLGWPIHGPALAVLGGVAAAWGLAGVACSVMIYATTHRSSWRAGPVATTFAATTAVCGLVTVCWASWASSLVAGGSSAQPAPFAVSGTVLVVVAGLMALKLAGEATVFCHLGRHRGHASEGGRRARLLVGDLRTTTLRRFGAGALGGVVLPLGLAATTRGDGPPTWLAVAGATLALAGIVGGELFERSLFFTATSAPR